MTAEHWRERAEEVRTKAVEMHAPEARATLLQLAFSYAKLAARAQLMADDREHYADVIAEVRSRSTKAIALLMTLCVAAMLLAACGSTVSPTFTPEQIRWGVGCQGPNAELYCGNR